MFLTASVRFTHTVSPASHYFNEATRLIPPKLVLLIHVGSTAQEQIQTFNVSE